ncbi:HAMP domain-containing histidine kinase [Arthrobacter sp. NamB2]|uniref:sensor histidine kinase n=1 Tax=Arthrobacter sp. NamB2 TaxID=2576035 RepID=UPI0010CA1951|nr:HAMP domain-containing sensor histidine kinase [Arthrobacter sp. NamB2]TKV25893.1 HAMP domain-containing histidine kinase [Arthrobacter sp. NamB2]
MAPESRSTGTALPADEPTTGRSAKPSVGSPVSARWRIVGWIVLTTALALLALLVTVRSLLIAGVDQDANEDVVQEVQEFTTFAGEAVDPQTARRYTSVSELLERYLSRQNSAAGEVILGVTDSEVLYLGAYGQGSNDEYRLSTDTALLQELRDDPAASGVRETAAGAMRWGKVDVEAGSESGTLVIAEFTRTGYEQVQETITVIFFVALGGLLFTAGIAWLVAGQILRPIRDVRRVAAEISESDLTARVPVQGRDDVAALAVTFNDMLDRLEQAYVTQRRFIDDASHELRTPITVIRGHLELIDDDPASRAATLSLVDGELSRMARIVSDLLLLVKAERADFVQPAPVDIAVLMLDLEAKMQALGDRRWLLMEVAEGVVAVDSQRITQAVLQLGANAVQYTPEKSDIKLGSAFEGTGDDRQLRIWVQDSGPGVTKEEAAVIFERFEHGSANALPADRLHNSGQRGGAGLGLSIVRAIADGHGGSAWVRSEPGRGSTFGLLLPVPERIAAYPAAPPPARPPQSTRALVLPKGGQDALAIARPITDVLPVIEQPTQKGTP